MATNQPDPDVNAAISAYLSRAQWAQQLALDYTETTDRLLSAYQRLLPRLQSAANDFNGQLADYFAANGELPSSATVRGMKTYQDLLARVETEMRDFGALSSNEAGILSERGIQTGIDAAEDMMLVTSGEGAGIIASVFNRPDPGAIAQAAAYVDSPAFRERASAFGTNAADNIADVIVAGVSQGRNPTAIARLINNWFAVPYAWSENAARTVQMWSYRTANHETYRQNSTVLDGWMWWSSRDVRTCPACLKNHGEIFPLSETLDGHHRCRCVPLPIVKGATWTQDVTRGRDWFDEQSPADQRAILGKGGMELYRNGQWDWNRASTHYHDAVYGDMQRASTLAEMTG
jgi:SPP1 gp7 family putative phage head morphogenesis protein